MRLLLPAFLLLLSPPTCSAVAQEYVPMNAQTPPQTCYGEACLDKVWCWQGYRFADLNQVTKQVTATVTSDSLETELCVESDTDDQVPFLLRSIINQKQDEQGNAAYRLRNRKPGYSAYFTSIMNRFFNGQGSSAVAADEAILSRKRHQVTFSAYSLSCISICKAPISSVEIDFQLDQAIKPESLILVLLGFALLALAKRLSANRAIFYLSGGMLGVVFAVSALVLLLVFRTAKPSKSQLGLAFMFQFSFVFVRDLIWRWVAAVNLDWVFVYVIFTFTISLGLVHYWIKRDGGALNPAFIDFVEMGIQILGAMLVVGPVPSATLRALLGISLVLTQVARHWFFVVADASPQEQQRLNVNNPFQTPSRHRAAARGEATPIPLSVRVPSSHQRISLQEYDQLGKEYTEASIKRLLASPEGKLWLSQNLDRFETTE